VVGLTSVGAVTHMEFQRWPIRLGSDAFAHGRIRRERVAMLTGTFEAIAHHLERLGVDAYRAVATAAMRDASNGSKIVTRIRRATGVRVDIISGQEEGRLSRDALVQALGGVVPPDTLLVDLGGGSLELHRARGRWGRSLPMGTVRMLERYPALVRALDRNETESILKNIRRDLGRRLNGGAAPLAIGTGGNLNVLAALVPARGGFHPAIDMSALSAAAARIAAIPPAERVRAFGLRPDRADVLTPAALVVLALGQQFELPAFVVPGTGLRETILRALANASETETQSRSVVRGLGRQLKRNASLARLVRALFDGLAPVHGLWSPARAPLLAAACLDCVDPDDSQMAALVAQVAGRLDERAREVAAYAAAVASATGRPRAVGSEDRHPADVLARLLVLGRVLARREVKEIAVDLTATPIRVSAGLSRALPSKYVEPLSKVLGVELRVR
jgi:exopolyphosphatase/guanosine-5'-triphosphate,3'-diphosphate pyrophosphatase